ncbi:MAG: TonB family protein [Bryobacteraceae bacterium]
MVLLSVILLCGTVCLAQEGSIAAPVEQAPPETPLDPAFAADIHRLMDDVGMTNLMDLQINQMMGPIAAMLKANPSLSPEFVDEFIRRFKTRLLNEPIQDRAAREYAKFFTREDIQQMIAYQESAVGRKASKLLPQIQTEFGGEMRALGERIGREVAIQVAQEHPEYIKKSGATSGSGASSDAGVIGGILGSVPPGGATTRTSSAGEHVDPKIEEALLIKRVDPVYPPLARAARIQGTVEFTIVIDTDGKVEGLTLVRGHPLLVNAAKEAVLQWTYQPTIMNGNPVKVVTEVMVNFHLEP